MLSWGAKRQLIFLSIIVTILIVIVALFGIYFFYHPASCSDGKKNGNEGGVDCGGNCSTVCKSAISDVKLDWVRVVPVKNGYWSVVAYFQNPNQFSEARDAEYQFKVYDADNILIAEPRGLTFIPAGQAFGVLAGSLYFGNRVPSRAAFEWQNKPDWFKSDVNNDLISIEDVKRSIDENSLPKITASAFNQGLQSIDNVFGFVVVYDETGNAMAASETVVDNILGGGKGDMVFSWPAPFQSSVGRVEILHWVIPKGQTPNSK